VENPLLSPANVLPSREGFEVACVLNPGAFRWRGNTFLVLGWNGKNPRIRPSQTARKNLKIDRHNCT